MRNRRVFQRLFVASTALLGSAALRAQVPAPLFAPPAVPTEISSIYDVYHVKPMWFRDGAETPAVAQLISILKRAPFDGGTEIEIRQVFEAADFGKEFTLELREQEERLRQQIEKQKAS